MQALSMHFIVAGFAHSVSTHFLVHWPLMTMPLQTDSPPPSSPPHAGSSSPTPSTAPATHFRAVLKLCPPNPPFFQLIIRNSDLDRAGLLPRAGRGEKMLRRPP